MHDTLALVLPANRVSIDYYLLDLSRLDPLLASLDPCPCSLNGAFVAKVHTYARSEETRMEVNLRLFKYNIDDSDTLYLITGPGRIERVSYECCLSGRKTECSAFSTYFLFYSLFSNIISVSSK